MWNLVAAHPISAWWLLHGRKLHGRHPEFNICSMRMAQVQQTHGTVGILYAAH